MGGPQAAPRLDAAAPFALVEPCDADPGIDAELLSIAAGGREVTIELVDVPLHPIIRRPARRHPAVADPRGALEHGLGGAAEPDRDGTPNGQRIDAGIVDDVVRALVGDERLGPELAQHLDLLLDA